MPSTSIAAPEVVEVVVASCTEASVPRRMVPLLTLSTGAVRPAVPFIISFSIVYLPVPVWVKSGVPGVLDVTVTGPPVCGVAP